MLFCLHTHSLLFTFYFYTHLRSSRHTTKDATAAAPTEYNKQLDLCQIEPLLFLHRSSPTFQSTLRLRARHCRCHSNHSNHCILWDLTGRRLHGQSKGGEQLPYRSHHNYRYTLEKTQQEGYSAHKSSAAEWGAAWEEGGWPDSPTPQAPPKRSRPFTCTTVQIIKKFSSFIHLSCWSLPWFRFFFWHCTI